MLSDERGDANPRIIIQPGQRLILVEMNEHREVNLCRQVIFGLSDIVPKDGSMREVPNFVIPELDRR